MSSQQKIVMVGTFDSSLAADHDQVVQQLFAIGLAMQCTHRRETSPEQALRISDHIDQLHDVFE